MKLALSINTWFPHGGLQRDFAAFVRELIGRGHDCRIYTRSWEGAALEDADLRLMPRRGFTNHRRDHLFQQRVLEDLAAHPVDAHIGFNKMPGLDIYFAGDPCYLEKAAAKGGLLYHRSARHAHFAACEQAVFAASSTTQILLLSEAQKSVYQTRYGTPDERLHVLPPGVDTARRAPENAAALRAKVREALGCTEGELVLLVVGSHFKTKGLDRAITALAHMRAEQPSVRARLLVAGGDNPRRYRRMIKGLEVADSVEFLGGRDDVLELMLAADLLVHPARAEAGGIVLLEAIAAGLPVVATDICGYASHIVAARSGIVLKAPFAQEALDKAVMRNIDGVYRADRRDAALLYARLTDMYSMHRTGAVLIEALLSAPAERKLD